MCDRVAALGLALWADTKERRAPRPLRLRYGQARRGEAAIQLLFESNRTSALAGLAVLAGPAVHARGVRSAA
jgi:hypothetical protein